MRAAISSRSLKAAQGWAGAVNRGSPRPPFGGPLAFSEDH